MLCYADIFDAIVPDFTKMYELYDACTVMFFYVRPLHGCLYSIQKSPLT